MQVGRAIFLLASIPSTQPSTRMNAVRILAWLSASAVFWILGGFAEGPWRLLLWAVALGIEYLSPAVRFWIPKYGPSSIDDWTVEGGHMAERCAGFIIIALGESIVVTGATFADLAWTTETVSAFVSAFIGALAMWWIYFHKGAEAGSEQISRSTEPGRLARLAYTYLHMPIVAGIIVSAVAETRAEASRRSFRSEDGTQRNRRAIAVSGRNDPLQARHSGLASTVPYRRHCRAWSARLVRERAVAVDAVAPDHRDLDHRRGLGIDLAEIRPGRVPA